MLATPLKPFDSNSRREYIDGAPLRPLDYQHLATR
jgi:hypothetical protein